MHLEHKLVRVVKRHEELASLMARQGPKDAQDFARMSREYAELTPTVERILALQSAQREQADLAALAADPAGDPEMKSMAEEELRALKQRLAILDQQVKIALLPKDEADERSAILEVRAGTGGEEAALFAAALFRMYTRYAENHSWRVDVLGISETGLGGYREASMEIAGRGVFARLKFESGAHRVQRVPETESSGRIHTSAATVACCRRPRMIFYRGQGSAHRCLSLQRPGRAIGQYHRQRRAHHPSAQRPCGAAAGRKIPTQEQGQGAEGLARPTLRTGTRAPRRRTGGQPQEPGGQRRPFGAHPDV
jgi:hypothetical protein